MTLYSLQTAMITRFGKDAAYNTRMNAITASSVWVITLPFFARWGSTPSPLDITGFLR